METNHVSSSDKSYIYMKNPAQKYGICIVIKYYINNHMKTDFAVIYETRSIP